MKKSTRLTALLIAIVLLLGTLSASAMAEGVSINDLEGASYNIFKDSATARGVCGDDNQYCVRVRELGQERTAWDRYYELLNMYTDLRNDEDSAETESELSLLLEHYKENHSLEQTLCVCRYPVFDPVYVPGTINMHDATCPWHFINLSVSEQYDELMKLEDEMVRQNYLNQLDDAKKQELEAFIASQKTVNMCDPDSGKNDCFYTDFIEMTGFERHEWLKQYVGVPDKTNPTMTVYEMLSGHILGYHVEWREMPPICTCADYESNYENMGYGSVNHGQDFANPGGYCAWHISQLPVEDQFAVISGLTDESEKQNYMGELSEEDQKLMQIAQKAGTTQAQYVEGKALISISTGETIAEINEETGAVVDCATGLTVGFVVNGEIVPPTAE